MRNKKLFKSEYSTLDAFVLRVNILRPMFGLWDAFDPVSHAILDVVEAQRELSDLFADDAMLVRGRPSKEAFKAAFQKRETAAEHLLAVIQDRDCWPSDYIHDK